MPDKPFSFPLIPEDDPIYLGGWSVTINPKSKPGSGTPSPDTPHNQQETRSVQERARARYLANQWVRDRNKNK